MNDYLAVCHFFGWTLGDIRQLSLREYFAAVDYIIEYRKAEAEAYRH